MLIKKLKTSVTTSFSHELILIRPFCELLIKKVHVRFIFLSLEIPYIGKLQNSIESGLN